MKFFEISGSYKLNYNISHLTWFKVGGNAEIFFKPKDNDDLKNILKQNNNELPITILGAGSNIIIRDGGVEGIIIKLGQNFTQIELLEENKIRVGAGCLNFNLSKFCEKNSITGFEFLSGIPGTIGGGVAMNAGSYGFEFKDIVDHIIAIDFNGNIKHFTNEEIGFSYRKNNLPNNLIITEVIFKGKTANESDIKNLMNEIKIKRHLTQPIKEKTGGSSFANPPSISAWKLIDEAGLRGYKIGDAGISELHCNFMVNYGDATAKNLEDLGEFVKKTIFNRTGIMLKWEIKIIGKY
jgi:UDP-N-acetylmuramate dehydrogenase